VAVRFRLLGAIEATVDGRPIPIGYGQLRWMLAVLLIEVNHPVSIDHIIDRVWAAQRLPRRPRHAVQHNIPLLRQALAPASGVTLARSGAGYQLSTDPDTIDLHRFRALLDRSRAATLEQADEQAAMLLEQAITLWRGEPFADVDIDTPWLHAQRATLIAHHHAARLDLTDIRLRQGRHAALLAELAVQTTQQPVDERLAGQYLLALYRSGRQAQALEYYQQLQHRLAEELGVDPSPPLRHLHQQILNADATIAAPAAVTPPPTTPPLPRQLPTPPRLFTGRITELAELDKALDQHADTAGAVMISGVGGIGKTWLALHWAHEHVDRFPDGQLYVDLRGFDPAGQPLAPVAVLRGFLESLGVAPAAVPTEPHALTGLYRSLVAGKRMLILLDNAQDAAQITALLPGTTTCAVLITSRHYLGGLVTAHGAHGLDVDVFSESEARHLLTRHLGHHRVIAEPEAVTDLLACCAGLPLALGVVAARATRRPGSSIAALAAELRDEHHRLDALDTGDPHTSLRSVLSWSVHALVPGTRHAFRLLALAPGPDISSPAAASLLAGSIGETQAVLRELEDASLIHHVSDRYRMHDLVRLYAVDPAGAEQEAAVRRVVDFYEHTACAGRRFLNPHAVTVGNPTAAAGCHPLRFTDGPTVMAWFDAEHQCLLAAQHVATVRGWHETVWRLAWALNVFHYRQGRVHDAVDVWRAGLAAAEHLTVPQFRIEAHRRLGDAVGLTGNRDEGITHLQQALRIAEEAGDRRQQALTHRFLTWAWERHEDVHRALEHANCALMLARQLDDRIWEAEALNGVGWLTACTGEYDQAREYCEAALALHGDDDNEGVPAVLDSLAYIDHRTGRHARSVLYYEQALARYRSQGSNSQAALTLDHLGHPYAALGQYGRARAVWQDALEMYRAQRRDEDVVRVQRQLDTLDEAENPDTTRRTPV